MRKSRFDEEQIIGVLREQEAGIAVSELCRNYGVSTLTFYKRKAKVLKIDGASVCYQARRMATARCASG